jgi:hypothetical protein
LASSGFGCADTAAGKAALNSSARIIPVVLVMNSSTHRPNNRSRLHDQRIGRG